MSSTRLSGSGSGDGASGENDGRLKIISPADPIRVPHEAKVATSKLSESSLSNAPKNHHHHPQQQQQHLLLLNRQECSSNQSGSDSGLGYTNSISSENSSLIVNATSLEQINAHSNSNSTNDGNNIRDIGVIKFVNNDRDREIQIAENDSFNIETQNNARSTSDSSISCIGNGKIDAAAGATTTTTTSIPNKAAKTDLIDGGIIHGIESEQLHSTDQQPAKAVKVSECSTNSTRTNQGTNLLSSSSSSLLISRTRHEPNGQEAFNDTNESSSENNARVISNIDDEAKIKHSTRRSANQTAISTTRPRENDDDNELDKAPGGSLNHATQGTFTRLSGADQLPLGGTSSVVSPHSDSVPPIKSSLKKMGDRSGDASGRSKHNRNVSFNQTVIVFCEEIETSSPSETFEPPLDYQDSPSIDEQNGLMGNPRGPSSRDFNQPQNNYASDDLDILSKIVGDDASSLTDDQLFGLLENGALLKNFDFDDEDKALTIDRLNSDQSYLCHNAISDSESESSLTIDTRYKQVPTVVASKPVHSSTKSKEPTSNFLEANHASGNQTSSSSKSDQETKPVNHRNNSQSTDLCPNPDIEPFSSVQPRSMPARVKVSTIDNNLKRQQKPPAAAQLDEVDSGAHTRSSACPKVIQTLKQNTAKAEPVLVRLTNVEPVVISKSQIREDIPNSIVNRQPARKPDDDLGCYQNTAAKPTFTSNPLIASDDHMNTRNIRLVDQHKQQIRDSSSSQQKTSQTPNQPSSVVNAQVIQTSQACHICRAIESNLHQNEFVTRNERAGLIANDGSAVYSNRSTTDQQQQQQLLLLQRTARPPPPHQHHGSSGATIESQRQKQLQLVPASQSSCVSCRESISRQQQQNCATQQPARPDLTNNLDQQQARPIACQLVYVVDQCGNRMKALQVVGPAQIGPHNNQTVRPIMIAADNCRFQAPSVGQNWIRMSNPTGQVLGIVRGAPVHMNAPNNPHAVNSNHEVKPPETGAPSAFTQQQRMQIVNHSAPRNHTVYYVRQPLGSQDFRQSLGSVTNSVARSFPDVHEIRRLDGIRAPTESPGLVQMTNHAATTTSPGQPENKSHTPHQFKTDDSRCLKLRRDDSDDPTFGFSRRPAVKVVTNAMRESQTQVVSKGNHNFNQATNNPSGHQRLLAGSLTLDRKGSNRDQSSQREVKENIPSTSSMSNINKTLTNYADSNANQRYGNTSKPKETNVGQIINSNDYTTQTSHQTNSFVQSRQDRKDQDRPEVAYVMNI